MKNVYILLTQTGTILSRAVKLYTKKEFNHASISLDRELNELYSFGRKKPYNPFVGGFIKEGIYIGTFKRFYKTKAEIFELPVTDEQYNIIKEKIYYFIQHRKTYKFNVIGIFLGIFNKNIKRKNAYYCSEFVKTVLESAGLDTRKIPVAIKPEDLKLIDNMHSIYRGYLREYRDI